MVDAQNQYNILSKNYQLLLDEYNAKKDLVKKQIFTEFEINNLKRSLNDAKSAKRSAKELIVQTKSQIEEIKKGIEETKLTFRNEASSK